MKGGKLRNQVTIQSPPSLASVAASGQPNGAWTSEQTVWADVAPLSGREWTLAQQSQSATTHRVTIRWLSGVTTAKRLLFGTRILQIVSVIDIDSRQTELQLMCSERLAS